LGEIGEVRDRLRYLAFVGGEQPYDGASHVWEEVLGEIVAPEAFVFASLLPELVVLSDA
jgi:hypothetical protein